MVVQEILDRVRLTEKFYVRFEPDKIEKVFVSLSLEWVNQQCGQRFTLDEVWVKGDPFTEAVVWRMVELSATAILIGWAYPGGSPYGAVTPEERAELEEIKDRGWLGERECLRILKGEG